MQRRIQRQQEWQEHVKALAEWSGSLESYCRTQGVSSDCLRYWRKKLSGKSRSAFVPVEVVYEPRAGVCELPDPRWLAELITGLCGGRR